MNRRIISALTSVSMLASLAAVPTVSVRAAANTPTYQTDARQMEELNRGLVAVKTSASTQNGTVDGVYLSWRLLGDESLENQAFDIYRNDQKIYTTGAHDATNWTDTAGAATDTYKVVKANASATEVAAETAVTPYTNFSYAQGSLVTAGTSEKNACTWVDIPISRPDPVERMGDGATSNYYGTGGANDASVGDLDGDGDYEIVLKWEPDDSKDSASSGYTGNTYIDAYELDPDNEGYMWRIDLGKNVTSGAHYTQFMVYDFDGDGESEIAMKTAPGTKDGKGNYVSEVGDTDEIKNVDNEASFVGDGTSVPKGKNPYTQYLTIFDGATGEALWTTEFIPYETAENKYWGDGSAKYNRSERYLAAVAYLDGVHPSIIMCRGYYNDSVIRAYNWDGKELTMLWQHVGKSSAKDTTLYGQGNHNLSIGDIDNDGKDEIVYGSAALDDDGQTVLGNTYLGHGDAMHMNDFNNDGEQEVFSVKEDSEGYKYFAMDLRNPATGAHFWESGKVTTTGDNGRGVMDNIDDEYAKTHSNALAIGWDSGHDNAIDLNGDDVAAKPVFSSRSGCNFLVYWDGDLGREILDDTLIGKYHAETGATTRFYRGSSGYSLDGSTNNDTKYNPSLCADVWGDWREEIILPINKGVDSNGNPLENPALRIYTSVLPTDYRLTTLMHDSQYRMSVAWQNVAYNQPTHTSYYVGSVALATDDSGNELNYLAPAVPYTNVTYEAPSSVAVTGISISEDSVTVEKGKSVTVNAAVEPEDATKKSITWTSSDTNVATVSNGVIKGVGAGTATITATANDTSNGTFSASCAVTVYETPVTGVTLSEKVIEVGMGNSVDLEATVYPDDATDKTVTWTSEDPVIAAVSDGTVTGVSYGKTKIIATTNDGGKTAECIVKVKPITVTDLTGEDAYVSSNTDDNTTFTGTATTGAMTINQATVPAEFHKDFEAPANGKATLNLKYNSGGAKDENNAYMWLAGHGYDSGLKFLDSDGNNIISVYDVHTAASSGTGVSTKAKVGSGDAENVSSWTKTSDSGDAPLNRSQIRWIITLECDYDNDSATLTLSGASNAWEKGETYEKTFALNGAKFTRVQYFTDNLTDYVTANPKIEGTVYEIASSSISGNTTEVDSSGDWVEPEGQTIHYAVEDSGRVWYNPTQPTSEYSAEKTFEGIEQGAIVTYDVDWYFSASTGRNSNVNYIQFGDALRLGAMTDGAGSYYVLASTDGGESYIGKTTDEEGTVTFDDTNAIWKTDKNTYTKNVKVIFDTKTKTVKYLIFDGNIIDAYSDFVYDATDVVTTENIDSVKFGFTRGGSTSDWEYVNGIDRIRVSQFIEGEEAPDINEVDITGVDENDLKKINLDYAVVDEDVDNITLIGVSYGDDDSVHEIVIKDIPNPTKDEYVNDSITFENDLGTKVKVFVWDSINGMKPVCDPAEFAVEHGAGA